MGSRGSFVTRVAVVAGILVVLGTLAASIAAAAPASPRLRIGLVDNAWSLSGDPRFYRLSDQLGVQVIRVNLNWGGPLGVARRRPRRGANPADGAYDWRPYDRVLTRADDLGIDVLFTIFGSPRWASGGGKPNRAPRIAEDLRSFAHAAARRYSGSYRRRDGLVLPPVRLWTAWNEPNLDLGLAPQFRRVRGRYVLQSAIDYAKICNAVYDGIHSTGLRGQRVACGVTSPRGNDRPRSRRPSTAPITFLHAMKRAGARTFDAYAHHPYPTHPANTPTTRPRDRRIVSLGNIDTLIHTVSRLYGSKPLWITEYGYQTNPPDPFFGVSWVVQARYLSQAFAIARRHPRIDLMLWFLMRDERQVGRWQSGLLTASGRRKPAFYAFQRLAR